MATCQYLMTVTFKRVRHEVADSCIYIRRTPGAPPKNKCRNRVYIQGAPPGAPVQKISFLCAPHCRSAPESVVRPPFSACTVCQPPQARLHLNQGIH